MATRIRDRDRGYKALLKRVTDAASKVTVGIHEDAGEYDDGASVAEVATYHELGLGVPRRSFIVDWYDENEAQNKRIMRQIATAIVQGKIKSIDQGIDRFGNYAVASIQQRIRAGISPDLEDSTIDQKGSSTPLIDQGTLWQSITFKIDPT